MQSERLRILFISQLPPSPPRFGAQARMHGIITSLAKRHDITAISLVDGGFDIEECRNVMSAYCREVVLIPNNNGHDGLGKRLMQLRSISSWRSFEHHLYTVPGFQSLLDGLLRSQQFDVVNLEFPYLGHFRLQQSPRGTPAPVLIVDAHEIAYDIVRQFGRTGAGLGRKLYVEIDWRKLRREELAAFRKADGICTCSVDDEQRVHREVPTARTVVVPNAADVEFYQPRQADPPRDENTIVFFGLMSTVPNVDGVKWFVKEIWPQVLAERPQARFKIIGARATREVTELAGPSVEVVGFVDDLRPHLAAASMIVVPLRLGGGTRLKIVEGMAMRKAIVSTSLGAEGIEATPDRDILIADSPADFTQAILKLMSNPNLVEELGRSARELAVNKYSWNGATESMERFYREIMTARRT